MNVILLVQVILSKHFFTLDYCYNDDGPKQCNFEGSVTPSVCVNAATTLLFALKTMDLLENGFATPFWSDSIIFNENTIVSNIAELWQR